MIHTLFKTAESTINYESQDDGSLMSRLGPKYGPYLGLGVIGVGTGAGIYYGAKPLYKAMTSNAADSVLSYTGKRVAAPFQRAANSTVKYSSILSEHPFVSSAIGSGIGATLGMMIDKDHPYEGAAVGAAAGAVGTQAINYGIKAAKVIKKMGPVGRGAAIILATLGLGVGATIYTHDSNRNVPEDIAPPDNASGLIPTSGIKNRLNAMNATGSLTLGLHNAR